MSGSTRLALLAVLIVAERPVGAYHAPSAPTALVSRRLGGWCCAAHRPRSLRCPRPVLCSDAKHAAPLSLAALARSSAFRTLAIAAVIALDITSYAFPLPFLPAHLAALGYGEAATSRLLSSFSLSALAAGALLVLHETSSPSTKSPRTRCCLLGLSSLAMCVACAAQAARPTFGVIYFCRIVQGALSQLAWFLSLAFAASLGPVGGTSAIAWVMVGNSVGEVAGPVFGAALFAAGGFRLPYAVTAGLSLALAAGLFASAGAEPPDPGARFDSGSGGEGGKGAARGTQDMSTACVDPTPAPQVSAAALPVSAPAVSGVEAGGAGRGEAAGGGSVAVGSAAGDSATVLSLISAGGGPDEQPSTPPSNSAPRLSARTGPLSDGRAVCLSLILALSCGLVRSALDIILPMWLRRQHGFRVADIARASAMATVFFVGGSALSGRLLESLPANRRDTALASAALLGSAAASAVLLPSHACGVVSAFCLFYSASAFIGVAATAALERRGQQIHAADAVMALSTLFWTAGFAVGGGVANVALSGGASVARQRCVMAAVGVLNAAGVGGAVLTRRRRGRAQGSGEIF